MKIQAKNLVVGQTFSVPSMWSRTEHHYIALQVDAMVDNGSPVVRVLVDSTTPFVSSQYAWFAPTSTLDVTS